MAIERTTFRAKLERAAAVTSELVQATQIYGTRTPLLDGWDSPCRSQESRTSEHMKRTCVVRPFTFLGMWTDERPQDYERYESLKVRPTSCNAASANPSDAATRAHEIFTRAGLQAAKNRDTLPIAGCAKWLGHCNSQNLSQPYRWWTKANIRNIKCAIGAERHSSGKE